MRLPTPVADRELSNNMTPMIDVVFLLIIFFLVSSHLARQETRLPLELPEASTHLPTDLESAALTISVKEDGTWSVGGNDVDEQGLSAALAGYHDRNGDSALVRVRTDRAVPYERVEPVLRQAVEAGLANVSIAVYSTPAQGGG